MTYSIFGILATVILLIINRDVLWERGETSRAAQQHYRRFLLGVLCYYVTDALWGILEARRLTAILFIDTTIHFIAMVAVVMLWTRYVVAYLENDNAFGRLLLRSGQAFLACELAALAVNPFVPVMFRFDEAGGYHAAAGRYVTLAIQLLMFTLTSGYTLFTTAKSTGTKRLRHRTIGLFGVAMVLLISVQVFYPLLPFYAIGYMLGTCLLHSFVVEDEKEEYRRELEHALERERLQKDELAESRETLKDALAAAENANRAKTAFLSSMSHEIRTPMNAIIGLNNIAMNAPTATDRVREYLEKIDGSAHHLLGIINDILDMSRIESGRMTIRSEEFSFAKNLEQVNTIISGQCRDKGLQYECRIIGKVDDYYIGDAMKFKQVMINILGNAVKFTNEGGAVTFLIEEGPRYDRKATLRLIISDTGIGMSPEYLPHIFDAFSQEDASSTSRYGSTGLGMPITKSIVELMNGHIEVESEKGKGTTFTVTVTLGESDRRSVGTDDGALDPHELSVLVIDDDRIALEHAEIVLGQIGVGCDVAESGWEGIDKARIRHARREDYDLILIDWRMPEMDGIETTRRLRSVVGLETPIIILTSFNWDDIESEAREAGVDTFVPKPLFAGSVMDEFREAFRRKNEALVRRTVDLKDRRVLLAEDVNVNAEIMMVVLSMREMDAELAANGRIAVDMFAQHEPGYYDAVLMDLRMPEMDGLEATRTIRAMDREDAKSIPIIALTANAFDEDVQRSMQAGLNAHLSKPVEPEALFSTLESLIR
ncbi:MAG: response regulator [Ruminococcaceae bacterium]|jgi:signal transduction histidine kinase/CheY-like chemotaxis protein|nr:response regulator [Oscillospiraceae bacterium]